MLVLDLGLFASSIFVMLLVAADGLGIPDKGWKRFVYLRVHAISPFEYAVELRI